MVRETLIIFSRYPNPGSCKTRLISTLGAQGAADLHREMTIYTFEQARQLRRDRDIELEVRFDGAGEAEMIALFGHDLRFVPQGAGDLGQRLFTAVERNFATGAKRTIAIGTDCPELEVQDLSKGFDALSHHDMVIGPAIDGGYYLVGLNCAEPSIFNEIAWGSDRVAHQTLSAAHRLGWRIQLLRSLRDVDRPEDIGVWLRKKNHEHDK